ncbi:unnamed protein product [Brassica napus]|uniref:(rape) hypothetical protein n=1 Tax=Brassica napus TaxID=3708 RepID=A0A816S831_BRANA|nr:unnamed protein product [Brassica napus]
MDSLVSRRGRRKIGVERSCRRRIEAAKTAVSHEGHIASS